MNPKRILLILVALGLATSSLFADVARDAQGKPLHNIQRAARGVFDLQKNTVSNLEFYTTNYGIFALNTALSQGTGIWPRGSQNHYIFGGGVWFAAKKKRPGTNTYRNYVTITYNPNSGGSWMVPGRIEDGDLVDNEAAKKYRVYFSTDFYSNDGRPLNENDGPNWPIWDANPDPNAVVTKDRYFGWYISDVGKRNTLTYPKGPAFISGEDIFATYKDTDLSRYEGGTAQRRQEGYPLRLQFEQMIYTWGFGDYRDIVFLAYNITNRSTDTLKECWVAPVMDVDLAVSTNLHGGAANDRVKFYQTDTTLNLAFQWTNTDRGERGQGFGYLGFTFLESPAVIKHYDTVYVTDANGNPVIDPVTGKKQILRLDEIIKEDTDFIRKDSAYYAYENQLGLRTFRNWSIDIDPKEDEERYNFIAFGQKEGDTGPGDKRFMMATGPFNMRPMDTVRVVVGIILANTSKGSDADGSEEDVQELVRKTKFAIDVYNKNFAAPKPPERAVFLKAEGLNNAVRLTWDSTAEVSVDPLERGMDFMGYALYRARRTDLDAYDPNTIAPNAEFQRGKGPFGWKLLRTWTIPTPFQKSYIRTGDGKDTKYPLIDSLRIVGPYVDANYNIIDSMVVRVMRVPRGCNLYPTSVVRNILYIDNQFKAANPYPTAPVIANFDTAFFSQPWGPYFKNIVPLNKKVRLVNSQTGEPIEYPYASFNVKERNFAIDSILTGLIYINRALMKYNPLLYQKKSINVDTAYLNSIPADGLVYKKIDGNLTQTVDTAYLKNTLRFAYIDGKPTFIVDAYVPLPKALWMQDEQQVNNALEEIYKFIKEGKISDYHFREFESSKEVQQNVIIPYMAKITDNRTFFDIGDDNNDGIISTNEDPTKTEKIINNVPYYYALRAMDEGDFMQPTPSKYNDASQGLRNFAEVYPAAPRAEKRLKFEVISVDKNIGGLYNFNFYALDPERAMQLFGGDTLELEFQPYWYQRELRFLGRSENDISKFGLYQRRMTLRNITKGQTLFDGITFFEVQPCYLESYRGLFTENAFSYVLADTLVIDSVSKKEITFGMPESREIITRTGKFSSGNFKELGYCYTRAMEPPAYGTLGFDFNFTIQQFGGNFRPDTMTIHKYKFAAGGSTPTTNATTNVGIKRNADKKPNQDIVLTTQPVNSFYTYQSYDRVAGGVVYGSFNNGPGEYVVEFLPGGEETLHLEWGPDGNKQNKRFRVPYLNVKVTNRIKYERPDPEKGPDAKAVVTYPDELPFMFIDTIPAYTTAYFQFPARYYPDPRNLAYYGINTNDYIGKFNISAYAWVNGRRVTALQAPRAFARPYGTELAKKAKTYVGQGKYYLTGYSEDGKDTVDFCHALDISGVLFGLDYVNRGGRFPNENEWGRKDNYTFGEDFKPGDKIVLSTFGGALGLPMPGAKVRVKISKPMEEGEKYTDKLLDQIQVVPNPYYVTHQGQRSPYDAKIYFTRLPKVCTIDIYTITGDLVISIKHDENNSSEKDRYALNVWDLLTKNGQRIASQTLAAVITTPDGAQTIKNFSIVVGGFRITAE
jgi:hypothetical protein